MESRHGKYRLEDEIQTEHLMEYNRIVEARELDPLEPRREWMGGWVGRYSERHHILPKCLHPELKDDPRNIVRLLPDEHFLAHWRIWMHYRETGNRFMEEKMCCAVLSMSKCLRGKPSARTREWCGEARRRLDELRARPISRMSLDGRELERFQSEDECARSFGRSRLPKGLRRSLRCGTQFKGSIWRWADSA